MKIKKSGHPVQNINKIYHNQNKFFVIRFMAIKLSILEKQANLINKPVSTGLFYSALGLIIVTTQDNQLILKNLFGQTITTIITVLSSISFIYFSNKHCSP